MQAIGLVELTRNMSVTFGRQAVAALLGFITLAIIARTYGPEGNGIFALALLLPSVLVTFMNLGMAPANVYHLGSAQISPRDLVAANLKLFFPTASLGLAIGAMLLSWYGDALFPGVEYFVLWLALLAFPISFLNVLLHSIFQGLERFQAYNVIAIAQPLALLFLVGSLAIMGNREIAVLVGAQLASLFFGLALSIKLLIPLTRKQDGGTTSQKFWKRTLSYGFRAHLSNVLSFLNYKADIFLVNLFLGPAAVGVYVVAVVLVERLWLISQAVSTVLLPRLSRLLSQKAHDDLLSPMIARWVMALTSVAALVVALLSGPIILLVFGAEFGGAVLVVLILLPGVVLLSPARIIANDLAARNRPELNMYTDAAVVAINIVANVLMIPRYGLNGAAAATTLAYAMGLTGRLWIYGRLTGNRWVDTLLLKHEDIRKVGAFVRKS